MYQASHNSDETNDFNYDVAQCFDRTRLERDLLEFYNFTSTAGRQNWVHLEDEKSVEFSIFSDYSVGTSMRSMSTFDKLFLATDKEFIMNLSPVTPNVVPGQMRPFSPSGTLLSRNRRPFSPASSLHQRRPQSTYSRRRPFSPDALSRPRSRYQHRRPSTKVISPTLDTTIDSSIDFHPPRMRPRTAQSIGISYRDDEFSDISFISGTSSIADLKMKKRLMERNFMEKYPLFPDTIELNAVHEAIAVKQDEQILD